MRKVAKDHGLYSILPDLRHGKICVLAGKLLQGYEVAPGEEFMVDEVEQIMHEDLTGSVYFEHVPVRSRFVVFGEAAYYFSLPCQPSSSIHSRRPPCVDNGNA